LALRRGHVGSTTVVDEETISVEILENNIFLIYPKPYNDKVQVKLKFGKSRNKTLFYHY
jgi:hypothetical protein